MTAEISNVERIYIQVRKMAIGFDFKPDAPLNESNLARKLGTSRTPLREALNRLVAEGFLAFKKGQGFSCRPLDPQSVLDLYETRMAIESEGVKLAVLRASDADFHSIRTFIKKSEEAYCSASPVDILVALDEEFHMRLLRLSHNQELERILTNLNARLRYIRWIDMEERKHLAGSDHLKILEILEQRDANRAYEAIREHIKRRREEAAEAVRRAYSRLYVPTI
ncbi:GntR family transcriptional regulator [Cohaesibacter gelatinilyticus]|uniref:Transcriptional regulator, GntR family n=1 Tax=Cohaesibacter gelatinilyticus TaxID=372072 RepID=A0A285PEP7_9HYPH|nr:GntR family transcriptional regulator [Cohaesibacter gelatinilyticus]SNZ20185.1 transcriptional regulator, GntR family [Cohaesibacter gelatinilyticus]